MRKNRIVEGFEVFLFRKLKNNTVSSAVNNGGLVLKITVSHLRSAKCALSASLCKNPMMA